MSRFLMIAAPVLILVCFACQQSGPELAPVEGVVTDSDGNPMPNVHVAFYPDQDGRASGGQTDESGRYRLRYTIQREGAMIGTHRVEVTANGRQVLLKKEGVTVDPKKNVVDLTVEKSPRQVRGYPPSSTPPPPAALQPPK